MNGLMINHYVKKLKKKKKNINVLKDKKIINVVKSEQLNKVLNKTKYSVKKSFVEEETNNIYYKTTGIKNITSNYYNNIFKSDNLNNDNYYKDLNDETIEWELQNINYNFEDSVEKKKERKKLYQKHSLLNLLTNNYLGLKSNNTNIIIDEKNLKITKEYPYYKKNYKNKIIICYNKEITITRENNINTHIDNIEMEEIEFIDIYNILLQNFNKLIRCLKQFYLNKNEKDFNYYFKKVFTENNNVEIINSLINQ